MGAGDFVRRCAQIQRMPPVNPDAARSWFLREWLAEKGLKQAAVTAALGWDRAKVSRVCNGQQGYYQADVEALARLLGIEPFELLMPPARARSMRRIAETARLIAAESGAPFDHDR